MESPLRGSGNHYIEALEDSQDRTVKAAVRKVVKSRKETDYD